MTVEADLFTLLKTVTTRVFPDFAPVTTTRPYCTYQQIGGEALTFIGREVPSKKNSEFQISVWADTRSSAQSLILAIESAMTLATVFQAKPIAAAVTDFDADVPVYGARQDFSVFSNR